jgi:hypothetical protein
MSTRIEVTQTAIVNGEKRTVRFVQNPLIDDVVIQMSKTYLSDLENGTDDLDIQVPKALTDFLIQLGVAQ